MPPWLLADQIPGKFGLRAPQIDANIVELEGMMDGASLSASLRSTLQKIEDVSWLIRRQRLFVAEVIVAHRNARAAREILDAMEHYLTSLIADRKQLEQQLAVAELPAEARQSRSNTLSAALRSTSGSLGRKAIVR